MQDYITVLSRLSSGQRDIWNGQIWACWHWNGQFFQMNSAREWNSQHTDNILVMRSCCALGDGSAAVFCVKKWDKPMRQLLLACVQENENGVNAAVTKSCCLAVYFFGLLLVSRRGESTSCLHSAQTHLLSLFWRRRPRGGASVWGCVHWRREESGWTEGKWEINESSRVFPSHT